jgi:DNA repair protein RadC
MKETQANFGPKGHRDRLREKFRREGAAALHEYELLELYLFNSIPQKDVKPIAKALLHRFGTFSDVCAAPIAELTRIDGIGLKTATDISVIRAAALHFAKDAILNRPILSSWTALMDYVRSAMQTQSTEDFRVLFLDRKNQLIADEVVARGTVDRCPVYPREIMKRVLAHDATAVILVHNHPSGDPTPSHADIKMTEELARLLDALDTVVHDHLVVGREKVVSFKQLGLM